MYRNSGHQKVSDQNTFCEQKREFDGLRNAPRTVAWKSVIVLPSIPGRSHSIMIIFREVEPALREIGRLTLPFPVSGAVRRSRVGPSRRRWRSHTYTPEFPSHTSDRLSLSCSPTRMGAQLFLSRFSAQFVGSLCHRDCRFVRTGIQTPAAVPEGTRPAVRPESSDHSDGQSLDIVKVLDSSGAFYCQECRALRVQTWSVEKEIVLVAFSAIPGRFPENQVWF
jgi:hypothetical protein